MSESHNVIVDYYENSDEDHRMSKNPLEYLRVKNIIARYLIKEGMEILDVGGATGVFSFWLSNLGHQVHLLDITPKHIVTAQKHADENSMRLASMTVGDACDLPFGQNRFDLVLLMGPLYHLQNRVDRVRCLEEARRVLKPDGHMVCEVISRFASMADGFFSGMVNDAEFVPIMVRDIRTGMHRDTSTGKHYFTDAYLHHADEVAQEIEAANLIFEDLIAVTSFGWLIADINEKFKDDRYQKILLDTLASVESDKSLMGISSHYMGIGRKPSTDDSNASAGRHAELQDALRAISSSISKIEKVQSKPMLGKSQKTLVERRLKALKIAAELIIGEMNVR